MDGTGDAAQELFLAVTWGNIKLVRMLLAGEPSLVGARNEYGLTALMVAVYWGGARWSRSSAELAPWYTSAPPPSSGTSPGSILSSARSRAWSTPLARIGGPRYTWPPSPPGPGAPGIYWRAGRT